MANPFDKIKGVLGTLAPAIGTALGGPLGGVAGSILAKAVTGDPHSASDAVAAAISTAPDPDTVVKLKQADAEFQEFMAQNQLSEDSLVYADKASARQMNVETKDTTPRNLAYAIVGFTFIYSFAALFGMIHYGARLSEAVITTVATMAGSVLGYLIREVSSVFGFYFGSSSGSQDKTTALTDTLKTVTQAAGK